MIVLQTKRNTILYILKISIPNNNLYFAKCTFQKDTKEYLWRVNLLNYIYICCKVLFLILCRYSNAYRDRLFLQ